MAVQSKAKIEEQLRQGAERAKRIREAGEGLKTARELLDTEPAPRNVGVERGAGLGQGQSKR